MKRTRRLFGHWLRAILTGDRALDHAGRWLDQAENRRGSLDDRRHALNKALAYREALKSLARHSRVSETRHEAQHLLERLEELSPCRSIVRDSHP